jgi:AcrR family transcriptional regulator
MPGMRRRPTARSARADVRTAILDAARARLEQGAYRELTVDGVMGAVGLSRTAFYRYFDDLGALVQALLGDALRPMNAAAERLAAEAASSDQEACQQALRDIVGVFAEHGVVLAATIAAAHYDEAIEHVVSDTRERFVRLTAEGLATRATVTGVRIPDPVETARALGAMNEGYLLEAFGRGQRVTVQQAVEALWPPWRQLLYRNPDSRH